jgi:hypothetical protein
MTPLCVCRVGLPIPLPRDLVLKYEGERREDTEEPMEIKIENNDKANHPYRFHQCKPR